MGFDASDHDILGGDTLPVGRNQPPGLWSSLPDFAKLSLYSVCFLVSFLVIRDSYHRFLRWRERSYRKATRRRHGIPDSDQRPFNVAYAAAVNARQEHQGLNKRIRKVSQQPSTAPQPARDYPTTLPGGLTSYPIRALSTISRNRNSVGAFNTHDFPPVVVSPTTDADGTPIVLEETSDRIRKNSKHYPPATRPSKHPLDGDDASESEQETNKKSRIQDDEDLIIQEDDEMDEVEHAEPTRPKRGSKRFASPDEEESSGATRTTRGDKRARKISRDQTPEELLHEPMEEDAEPLSDSVQSPRGKKRDRGEDGLGDEDSGHGDSDEKHRRRRQRRHVSGKKIPRGQKRGRDLHTVESESESEFDQSSIRRSRKKRGKQTASSDDEDISMDDAPVSLDPLCKGRVIGEEWELGGTRYKVGPNGDRLRQSLVKRKRPKYPMPVDSEHPDKNVMIDVIVETWLTEEQYRIAKENFELAWQDPPQIAISAPGSVHTPVKRGKNLLWSSTTSHPESPVSERKPIRQSVATNIGLHLNPFQQSQYNGKGRITGAVHSPIAASPDTPKLKHVKSYSKWEKQDLEAEAMSKIRQRLQEQKKAAEEQNKPVVLATPVSTISSAPSVPNFFAPSSVKPAEVKPSAPPSLTIVPSAPAAKEAPKPSFGFGLPPASKDPAPTPSTAPLPFVKPAAPASVSTPSVTAPTPASAQASAAPFGFSSSGASTSSAATASKPSFSFGGSTLPAGATATEQPKQPTPVNTSTTVPNFFAKPAESANSQPKPVPVVSAFGTTTTATPSTESSQPKFAFGVSSKPTPAPAPATSSPSPFGGMQQPPQPANSFGAQSQLVAQNTQPKFAFGVAGGSSTPQPKLETPNGNSSSAFAGFGGNSTFSSNTTAASSSAFGINGNKDSKPAEAQKPAFSFGASPAAPSNMMKPATSFGGAQTTTPVSSPASANPFGGAPASATTDKPSFSFGGTVNSTQSAPKASFSFGPKPSGAPAAASTTESSKPAFGFGASNPPSTPAPTPTGDSSRSAFSFGTPNTPEQQQPTQPAFGAIKPPTFTFGTPASGDKPAPSPSAFGFGASSPFSFGKPEEKK